MLPEEKWIEEKEKTKKPRSIRRGGAKNHRGGGEKRGEPLREESSKKFRGFKRIRA